MKKLLSKQLRNIHILHRWIKRRTPHAIKPFGVFADKVFDSMFLSIKSIGTHSVRFIISYTIPMHNRKQTTGNKIVAGLSVFA